MIWANFHKLCMFEQNLAVDEKMISYSRKNSLDQFIRGKSIRFGYKPWALCNSMMIHNFNLYISCGPADRDEWSNIRFECGTEYDTERLITTKAPYVFDALFKGQDYSFILLTKVSRQWKKLHENFLMKCPTDNVKVLKEKKKKIFAWLYFRSQW